MVLYINYIIYCYSILYVEHLLVSVTFSSWSPWSDCSIPCEGEGISTRSRSCQYPPNSDGTACLGHLNEIKACDSGPCPGIKAKFYFVGFN